jgi:hypothetical protein
MEHVRPLGLFFDPANQGFGKGGHFTPQFFLREIVGLFGRETNDLDFACNPFTRLRVFVPERATERPGRDGDPFHGGILFRCFHETHQVANMAAGVGGDAVFDVAAA